MIRSFGLIFVVCLSAFAEAPLVDQLRQQELQAVFQQLKTKSLSGSELTDEALNRAALQGLIQRLGNGLQLETIPPVTRVGATRLLSETLAPNIAYLRPATFTIEELAALDVALENLAKSTATTLILDLRVPANPGDPHAATQFLSRFLPEATPLFEVKLAGETKPQPYLSKGKPRWSKGLILLIDAETNNVAEVIAAVLQKKLQAFTIGTATTGHAIVYQTLPLTSSLQARLAVGEALIDTKTLFRQGLQPALEAVQSLSQKNEQFLTSEKSGMKRYAFETERPRMNEAALVAGTNPELEYQIAKSAGEKSSFDEPAPQDLVLQQALDFLTAQTFLKSQPAPEIRKAEPEQK